MNKKLYRETNKEAWNQVVDYHLDARGKEWLEGFSKFDNYATFNLFEYNIYSKLDLKGKNIIQAPCNNGREILSLINMGASYGLGIDIANKNIDFAHRLLEITSANVDFICSDIYEVEEKYNHQFDIAIISVGTLNWMPNLKEYLEKIMSFLKEEGELLVLEMHPILCGIPHDYKGEALLELTDSYFDRDPYYSKSSFDYYGGVDYDNPKPTYEFQHTISDIIQCISDLGFTILDFKEHPIDLTGGHSHLEKKKLLPLSYHLHLKL